MFIRTLQFRTSTDSRRMTMMRRVWVRMCLGLGLGLVSGLVPVRARAMQYGGGDLPPPPQATFPGLTVPGGDPNASLPAGCEVLARGPVHEAFATPVVYNPAASVVCPTAPPDVIQETPPDQRPDGCDVEWIPGYWAWEDERQNYIWVSGIWRDIPPGRQWIPGYWGEATGGYCWTAGFWATAEAQGGLDYLPTPPASLENGPNTPCPGDDYAWGPGQWVWQQTQYNWQPGYWYQTNPNWVWNPACYQTTPSGCVYNSGYWDYNLAQRGIAFAPVCFRTPAVAVGIASPIVYQPSCVLPVGGLLSSLFVQPSCGRYCFGDYYGASTAAVGGGGRYVPWFQFCNNRVGYDPIFSTMACRPNRLPNWDRGYREDYHYRVAHPEYRPRPTYTAQQTYFQDHPAHHPIGTVYDGGGIAANLGGGGYHRNAGNGGIGGPGGYGGGSVNTDSITHPSPIVPGSMADRHPGAGKSGGAGSYGGGSNGGVTHPSPTVPGSMASHHTPPGSGGGVNHPPRLVEPYHQWAGNNKQQHPTVPVQADHRGQIAQRQTAMTNFQRQRSQQESLGKAQLNHPVATNQATRPTFRNQLPHSPVVAATAPRNGSRGPAQVPNHPVNQASYHPQFGAQHQTIPATHHEQGRPPQMHQGQPHLSQMHQGQPSHGGGRMR